MKQRVFRKDLFVNENGKWIVVGNKCKNCGTISFPKNDLCVFCLGEEMEEVKINTEGELYSYTITRRAVDRWTPPHAIGMIRIPEQQVSLLAPLVMDGSDDSFTVGEKMEMIIDRYWEEDGEEVIGYKYRKLGGTD